MFSALRRLLPSDGRDAAPAASARHVVSGVRSAAFFAGLTAALVAAVILPYQATQRTFVEGSIAPVTVKSPAAVPPFPSTSLTQAKRRDVAATTPQVLIADVTTAGRQQDHLGALMHWLERARIAAPAEPTDTRTPDAAIITAVQQMAPDRWEAVQGELTRLLNQALLERTTTQQLPSVRAQLLQRAGAGLNAIERLTLSALLEVLLKPTLVEDTEATALLREAATKQVEPVMVGLQPGEVITRDGQVVTALQLEKLREAGVIEGAGRLPELLGGLLLMALMAGVLALFIYVVQPRALGSKRRLLLLGTVLALTVVLAKIGLPGRPMWAAAFPVAAAPLLVSVLLQLSLGLTSTLFLAVTCAFVAGFSSDPLFIPPYTALETLEFVVLYLVTGIIGAIVVGRATRNLRYFAATAAAGGGGVLVVVAFWLLNPGRDTVSLPWQMAAVLGGNMAAAALSLGFAPVLGLAFGVTTRAQLHELAQTDHPLLRRLLQEAPGTYYHSLLVGNMAEQAAEAVGADALLARVGAYYHDIGKLKNPGCFIENQRGGENIHDRLDPYASAKMIIAHVPDGVALAQQHRLPDAVMAFIREHHGCRITVSFYNRATHLYEHVDPHDFQYPGPPAQTRETAIVMLADSVEAISRSEEKTDPEDLETVVDRVFAERMAEGELSQCDLTLRDIESIRGVFKSALRAMYHPRVRYPLPAGLTAGAPLPDVRTVRATRDSGR